MLDGLAQRLFLGLLQRRCRLLVEAGRIFPVRPEHLCEEGRRHLVMLGVGVVGVFGDGARRHFVGEARHRSRHRRWRAAPRCASTAAGSRRGSRRRAAARVRRADDAWTRNSCRSLLSAAAAERTCWCATGSRDSARRASAASAASSGGMPVTWTRIQYMKTGASSVAQPQADSAGEMRDHADRRASRTIRRNSSDAATSATARHRRRGPCWRDRRGSALAAHRPALRRQCRCNRISAPR